MSAVPKFGSFKPKVPVSKNENATSSTEATRDRLPVGPREESHRSRKHGDDRRNHSDRYRREKSGDRKGPPDLDQEHPPSPGVAAHDEASGSSLFTIDRRGDPKNLEYGSLHRYSIPSYHRTGFGHVIGTASNLKIDREESTQKELALRGDVTSDRKRPERLLTAKRRNFEPRSVRLVVPTMTARDESELYDDFLEFSTNLKRKRGSSSPSPEPCDTDYRSIEGKAEPQERPADEDLEFASDPDAEVTQNGIEKQIRQENAVLSKKTKEDPLNINAWMDLIDHQSQIIKPGSDHQTFTSTERHALAEIRLSIYERVLKHIVKAKSGHERLLLGSLEQGSLVWETLKLESKWNDALKECPTSTLLWTKYLDFAQTSTNFSYETCKEAYMHCLKILQSALANNSERERVQVAYLQAYVLLRYTAFVRDAGYEELANATWQVLLEYHFFKPDNLAGKDAELESLEAFWESDVPRLGEEDALGWKYLLAPTQRTARGTGPGVDPRSDSLDSIFSLAARELRSMTSLQLPIALNDDSDTDDPYRRVMFSDLQDVVGCLNDVTLKGALLDGFLSFMHLPPLPTNGDILETSAWQSDPYIRTELVDIALAQELEAFLCSENCSIESFRTTTFSLFREAFRSFHNRMTTLGENGDAISRFVDRALESIVLAEEDNDDIAEYYLAFKLQVYPLEVSKVTKRLLKSRPSSLRLYNAYALIETCLDRLPKAKDVWALALNMDRKHDTVVADQAILLWHSWVSTLIYCRDETSALACLLSMPDGPNSAGVVTDGASRVSAGQRLRILRHVEEGFDRMKLKFKQDYAVLYAECKAWLVYILEDHDCEAGLVSLEKCAASLPQNGSKVALELLQQAKARLIGLHVERRRSYKPTRVRQQLAKSITIFPENTFFLALHTKIGSQTRIDDRLRDAARHSTLDNRTVGLMQQSVSIMEEIRRCNTVVSGSTKESVRSRLKHALLNPDSKVKHSSTLWMVWFHFEAQAHKMNDSSNLQKLRQVFFDGLRTLPWCKSWIMLGIRCSAQAGMLEHEVKQFHGLLAERGLRIRYDKDHLAT